MIKGMYNFSVTCNKCGSTDVAEEEIYTGWREKPYGDGFRCRNCGNQEEINNGL